MMSIGRLVSLFALSGGRVIRVRAIEVARTDSRRTATLYAADILAPLPSGRLVLNTSALQASPRRAIARAIIYHVHYVCATWGRNHIYGDGA